MPKLGMEPVRRRQLIDATIASIGRYGLADTTVQRISREAGVSSGIIHHYFGGKSELLEATMRRLLQDLRDDVVAALRTAQSPEDRIIAVIDSNFAPSQFQAGAIAAWLAFWAEAPHVPALGRLQRLYVRRFHSNLMHSLGRLLPTELAAQTAQGLAALIDGLWLRAALAGSLDGAASRAIAIAYLRGQLPPQGRR
jgi:TetR/AcrR family transcriptional regulator, transcriptional repressor of bet genes